MTPDPVPEFPWKMRKQPKPNQCPVFGCKKTPMPLPRVKSTRGRLCSCHSMQLWRMENPARAHFTQIRDRAKRKKIPFRLTFAEYLTLIEGTRYTDQRGRERHCYHIDRIDAVKGYELANLRVITATENCTKGATEDKERRRAYVAEKIKARAGRRKQEEEESQAPDPEPYHYEPTEDEPF